MMTRFSILRWLITVVHHLVELYNDDNNSNAVDV